MRIDPLPGGGLVVVQDGTRLSLAFGGGSVLFAVFALYRLACPADSSDPLVGATAGAVLLSLGALVTFERSVFTFDVARRVVDREVRRVPGGRRGRVPFDDVVAVATESLADGDDHLTRRLVLRTRSGGIPFTRAYSGDPDGECLRAAARLNGLFGIPPEEALLASVRALASEGRILDAVRLLRAERGLSLTEARAEVEGLTGGRRASPVRDGRPAPR